MGINCHIANFLSHYQKLDIGIGYWCNILYYSRVVEVPDNFYFLFCFKAVK